jgi:DNA end-binding protein Ku
MAPRPFWKGYLKLLLVTCPVTLTPATTEGKKVKFHTLNRATGNRIESRYVDAESNKPIDEEDEAKGYEHGEQDFVLLEDEELKSVALESTRTIDIGTFVERDSIEWVWYDKPHYLAPDGDVGEEAFAVIREAMVATGTVGIARLVLYRRERAVMIEPRDKGIVLWTLRYGDEVRDAEPYFEGIKKEKPDPKLMSLVTKVIEERTRPWGPELVKDPIQDELLKIIADKKKGKKVGRPEPAEAPAPPSNVINIMDALKKSIAADKKTKAK